MSEKEALEGQILAPVKTEQQLLEERLLGTLSQLGGQRVSDDDLIRQGNTLILPETMTPADAIRYLEDHIEQMEEETRFERSFRYRPWDGAHALQSALVRVFGTAGIGKPTYTFFGQKIPPKMKSINVGVNKTTQVPWGELKVPLFHGTMYLSSVEDPEYGSLFYLVIDAPRKYRAHIEGLFTVVAEELATNSIYRGQAIDGQEEADFLDLTGVDPRRVIYSDEVIVQLEANVWSLLKHGDAMRQLKMPLKRAILLEGPYGTGKTLAAFLTAQVAVENGWSFIYCRPGKDSLDEVMGTARLYQPAVVFFEDVDILAETGEREDVTRLLDLFDGITAKGTELMAILTTNHKERIHQGMVRPGRLDAMIHIGALDEHGCQRMIEATVPAPLLADDIDFAEVYEAMTGFLPAFVKEAIDRTMRYGIARNGGVPQVLKTEDFVQAANGLRPQLELMEGADEGKVQDNLSRALRHEVAGVLEDSTIKLPNLGESQGSMVPGNGEALSRRK